MTEPTWTAELVFTGSFWRLYTKGTVTPRAGVLSEEERRFVRNAVSELKFEVKEADHRSDGRAFEDENPYGATISSLGRLPDQSWQIRAIFARVMAPKVIIQVQAAGWWGVKVDSDAWLPGDPTGWLRQRVA